MSLPKGLKVTVFFVTTDFNAKEAPNLIQTLQSQMNIDGARFCVIAPFDMSEMAKMFAKATHVDFELFGQSFATSQIGWVSE